MLPTSEPEQTDPLSVGDGSTVLGPKAQSGSPPTALTGPPHARGLLIVGLYKLSKTIFFTALGAGALDMVHRNLGEVVLRLVDRIADTLRIDPTNRFLSMLMDRADLIGGHQLRQASMASFGYAALCLVEGTGLMLRKVWAEYFTVVLTAAAMPWEGYELMERYTHLKLVLLLLNAAVLLYLLAILKKKDSKVKV